MKYKNILNYNRHSPPPPPPHHTPSAYSTQVSRDRNPDGPAVRPEAPPVPRQKNASAMLVSLKKSISRFAPSMFISIDVKMGKTIMKILEKKKKIKKKSRKIRRDPKKKIKKGVSKKSSRVVDSLLCRRPKHYT
jgi:hypothetical protein